jgi:predicted ATPase
MIGFLLLERYRIDSELGKGGMGIVYRAYDTLLEREVAIKVLSEHGLSRDSHSRLLGEARAVASLSHPNIVTVHDVGEHDGALFIVMELVSGQSLLEQSVQDLDQVLEIGIQLCQALAHAHQHGVIHRDLKPENVILVEDLVKLMDFGLARSMTSRLSADGDMVGTAYYLAPEQALGMEVDARTDLYSLGVMLYEMVTGRLPFTAGDALTVISQHLHAPVVPPRTYNEQISPGFNVLILRLMGKTREERPSSTEEVLSALTDLLRNDTEQGALGEITLLQQIVQGRLVGRGAELDSLRQHWRQAQGGIAQLVLISGEPGVGKTRLANELISFAQLHGGRTLQGGCYEYEASVPYLPFTESLRDWVHKQSIEQLEERLGDNATELAKLAPEIEAKMGPLKPNPALSPDQERMRMFDHFARLLSDLAAEKGLLLFLDDLHWADQGTLSLVHYLLRRMRNERLLILGGYREVELDRNHPLAAALVEWNRERLVTRIQLGRLSREDCSNLLASMFAQDEVSPDFVEAIYLETEGNPFFIEEVIKALIDSGQIYRENLEWQRGEIADLAIPQSIKDAIGRRLNRLSEQSAEILQQAAILGKVFNFKELVIIYSDGGGVNIELENNLLDALDEGLKAQLIRALEGESFSFTHDKIRETLYEEMNTIRRRRFHNKVAQGIESSLAEQDFEDHLPDLAYHYLHGGDLHKGMKYAAMVGEHARTLYAKDEALNYYFQAAEAADMLQLSQELSDFYVTIGDLYLSQGLSYEAIEHYNNALSLVNNDQHKAIIKMKIGESYANVGDARGLDFLNAAKRELNTETQNDNFAEALTWLGRYYHYQAQHHLAIDSYREALTLLASSDKYYLRCQIYSFLSGAHQHLLEFNQSNKWAKECLLLGEENDDPAWIAVGNEFLSENATSVGKWHEALKFGKRDREIGEKIGAQDRIAWGTFCETEALFGLGQLDEALRVCQAALNLAQQLGENRLAILLRSNLCMIQTGLNLEEEAEENAQIAVSQADEIDQDFMQCLSRSAFASMLVKQKEWGKAVEVCKEGRSIYEQGENLAARSFILSIAPEAYLGAGKIEEALAAVEDQLQIVRKADTYHSLGVALRMKGQITAEIGDFEKAFKAYQESINILEDLDSQLELGRAYYQRGRLWGIKHQRDKSAKDLQKASKIFNECGAKHDLKLAQDLLEALE